MESNPVDVEADGPEEVDPKVLAQAAINALKHFLRDEGDPDIALATADALLMRLRGGREVKDISAGGLEL